MHIFKRTDHQQKAQNHKRYCQDCHVTVTPIVSSVHMEPYDFNERFEICILSVLTAFLLLLESAEPLAYKAAADIAAGSAAC